MAASGRTRPPVVAAIKAVELGYGGISRVSRACGLSRVTLNKGVEELETEPLAPGRTSLRASFVGRSWANFGERRSKFSLRAMGGRSQEQRDCGESEAESTIRHIPL